MQEGYLSSSATNEERTFKLKSHIDADAGENTRSRNGTCWFSSEFKLNPMHLDKSDMIPQDLYCLLIFDSVYSWCLSSWLFFWWSGGKMKAMNESRRRANAEEQSCHQSSWQLVKMMHYQDCCLGVTGSKLLLPAWHVRTLFASFEYLRYECRLKSINTAFLCHILNRHTKFGDHISLQLHDKHTHTITCCLII